MPNPSPRKQLPPIKHWSAHAPIRWGREPVRVHWMEALRRWLRGLRAIDDRASGIHVRRFNQRYFAKHWITGSTLDTLLPLMREVVEIANRNRRFGLRADLLPAVPDTRQVKKQRIEKLEDWYIAGNLAQATGMRASDIPAPLIEAKRAYIKVKRELKERMR